MTPFLKEKKKSNFYDNCFIISIFAMLAILLALPYQNNGIISLGTYAIAGCSVFMCIKYFLEHFNYSMRREMPFLSLVCVCVVAVIFSPADIKTNLVVIICFLEIPMFLLCGKEIKTKLPAKIFLWVQYALSFYYLHLSLTDKAYYFKTSFGETELEELTLAYHNPNETAMYLFACFLSLLIAILFYKRLILRILFGVNAVLIFILVWLTQSRAGMLSCILAVVAFAFIKKIKVSSFIAKIAIAIPWVMVAAIYFFNEQLAEINFLGSSFETGRINVFEQVFSQLDVGRFLFGDFAVHRFDNLHNVYISVFGTIGIFGVIIYALYLSNMLITQSGRTIHNFSEKMAFYGMLLMVIYASVEATFFVGGSAYAMCFIGIYISSVFGIDVSDDGSEKKPMVGRYIK